MHRNENKKKSTFNSLFYIVITSSRRRHQQEEEIVGLPDHFSDPQSMLQLHEMVDEHSTF